ncbi:MAG: hypothetical protein LBH79_03135 [Nitrososphaerota archaeon]|jgi:site-specific recombinase XerD|nr:hypothetical protein [Nitrososphaerota archaeon]
MRLKTEETNHYKFTEKFGRPLEEYQSVRNATETLNKTTIHSYKSALSQFFLWIGEDPDTAIANRKTQLKADDETADHYERKVRAYKKMLEDKGETGRCIAGKIGRISGFFANNSKRFSLNLGTMKYNQKRKVPKYSPDNTLMRQLYSFADCARDRLIIALAYQNGLAPVDVASIICGEIPPDPFKYYQSSRAKNGVVYHAVTTPEIVQEYQAYRNLHSEIKDGEPLFRSREKNELDGAGVSQILSNLIIKAGFDDIAGFYPKSLRDGFEDALVDADLPSKVKEAMMGHSGGIEHEYGGQKRLEARLEEAMQKAYSKLILTEVVTTNGKSAQKIVDLDNAVIESQKKILALETTNTSLTERLTTTEKELSEIKQTIQAVVEKLEKTNWCIDKSKDKTK